MGPNEGTLQTAGAAMQGGASMLTTYALAVSGLYCMIDIAKNLLSYDLRHSTGQYPVDPTVMVVGAELIKLIVSAYLMIGQQGVTVKHLSPLFLVPTTLYLLNDNIFYYAMHHMSPVIWTVLLQLRIVVTALVYRVLFKREISWTRWLCFALLMLGVVLAQLTKEFTPYVTTGGILLAGVSICISVASSISTELLLKGHPAHFFEQQVQLYGWGLLSSLAIWEQFGSCNTLYGVYLQVHRSEGSRLEVLAVVCLQAVLGITTAVVLKNLDNIVKLFASALSIVGTGLMCHMLFPSSFEIAAPFLVGTVLVLSSTYTYAQDRPPCASQS